MLTNVPKIYIHLSQVTGSSEQQQGNVSISSSSHFVLMGANGKESMARSSSRMVAKSKRPQDDATPAQREEAEFRATEDAAYAHRPSPSAPSSSSSSSGVESTLATILDQLQLIRDDLGEIRDTQAVHGDRLDLLFDNMSQMNTRIGRIASP